MKLQPAAHAFAQLVSRGGGKRTKTLAYLLDKVGRSHDSLPKDLLCAMCDKLLKQVSEREINTREICEDKSKIFLYWFHSIPSHPLLN